MFRSLIFAKCVSVSVCVLEGVSARQVLDNWDVAKMCMCVSVCVFFQQWQVWARPTRMLLTACGCWPTPSRVPTASHPFRRMRAATTCSVPRYTNESLHSCVSLFLQIPLTLNNLIFLFQYKLYSGFIYEMNSFPTPSFSASMISVGSVWRSGRSTAHQQEATIAALAMRSSNS